MKSEKIINWVAQGDAKVEITINVERSVEMETAYSDGWNVELGNKTYESLEITIYVNGKCKDSSRCKPYPTSNQEAIKKGAYASVGHTYMNEEKYNLIIEAIKEAEKECISEEYLEVKAIENEKVKIDEEKELESEKKYQQALKSGLCPRCGTYCYGDCTSH